MSGSSEELDFRGMGGFIPYMLVEERLKRTGRLQIAADPEAVRLLKVWAERRGYLANQSGPDTIIIYGHSVSIREETSSTLEKAPLTLLVDVTSWSNSISQKLADVRSIIDIVLSAPVVYRGPPATSEFYSAIASSKGPLLLRVQVKDMDYFLVVINGRIVAGARLGAPLNPGQAENLLKSVSGSSDVMVTLYNISALK